MMTAYQQEIVQDVRSRAHTLAGRLVLTDGEDERVVHAARELAAHFAIQPVLLGRKSVIRRLLPSVSDQTRLEVWDLTDPGQRRIVDAYWEASGLTGFPSEWHYDPSYVGALLVRDKVVSGMVGGADVPTGTIIRAGIKIVGLERPGTLVSGCFGMILPQPLPEGSGILTFGDAAVMPHPTAEQLAQIAVNTATAARQVFAVDPVVALLSFSSHGSAEHADVSIVREAVQWLRQESAPFQFDGELQADAAIVPAVSARKAPQSPVGGRANVLIFPNLDAANIAYKLVQRVAGAVALGVILSGLARPVNDLSRGCDVDDIINMAAVTMLQSQRAEIHQPAEGL